MGGILSRWSFDFPQCSIVPRNLDFFQIWSSKWWINESEDGMVIKDPHLGANYGKFSEKNSKKNSILNQHTWKKLKVKNEPESSRRDLNMEL